MKYDLIILGTGGIGSSALLHAADRGLNVLGLDRFPPGHDKGSSHGETRIIRMSYFEHPDYVPLLRSAYEKWDALSERCGMEFFRRCGLAYFGAPDSPIIRGVLSSASEHQLDVTSLSLADARERFPGFEPVESGSVLYEPDAGYLLVEESVRASISEAVKKGATHLYGETVQGWSADEKGVAVRTDRNTYRAERLIITAGSWAGEFLPQCGVRLRILRKHLHWFAINSNDYLESEGCPGFFYDTGGSYFYGFPAIGSHGLKVSEHSGGTEVSDPLQDERLAEDSDNERIRSFLSRHLPGVSLHQTRHEVCYYTMSPDEHFIVDQHPGFPNVAFAAGLSGHGFKFASALGDTLVSLALEEQPAVNIDFLRLSRFGT